MFPYLEKEKKDWLLASATNNHSAINQMVEKYPDLVATSDPYTGYSALHWAAKHDNDEMISSLMSASSSLGLGVINRQSHGGYTPLHVAAINKSQRAFSTLMMDFKADRKIRDYSGKTATSYLRNVINSDLELKRNHSSYK